MTAPILTLNNIEVIYDRVVLVLKGVSLSVPQGGIVALDIGLPESRIGHNSHARGPNEVQCQIWKIGHHTSVAR